ncbi:pyrroline-5-carboxylate reductase [Clostridium sp. 19966]|uniref:pyrroline-5-carboxylate reductase n=1 Tax=Clostridium sp. 19966 TaxID=2768166 RepID=UPI0028DED0D3|nr:pyrroline-5-carboxylate reductase [Clostridium sp. 19966]MDT8718835.1 pyrroline-5-carboxylate reductase [Clostridium sp. 19966]
MDKKIGFIGCGNMGEAMLSGILKANLVPAENIMISRTSESTLKELKNKYDVNASLNNKDVAAFSDILILAVKPNKYIKVIKEIKAAVKKDVLIVSIAAGITIETIEKAFEKDIKIVRSMPNTPALVGEAMSALTPSELVSPQELKEALSIFESFGKAEVIDENLMDMIPSVSGSSPAYVFMFIEALADGAVLRGMPRDKAYKFAAQAVLGAAKMVLETGEHPGSLKDKVCSPGGTTIEAVYSLEANNFRASIIAAMESCTKKAEEMSKK